MKIQLREFKLAYNTAVKDKLDSFEIQGFAFLTKYAKYLLQYFEHEKLKDGDYIDLEQKKA